MHRRLRYTAAAFGLLMFGGWLIAGGDSRTSLPSTLDAIQVTLKQLETQIKALQETVKHLAKDAKNNRNLDTAASAPSAAPAAVSNFQKAKEAYKQGQSFEALKRHRDAIEAYTQAVEADPRSDAAFLHRGYEHHLLGEYPAAAADFTSALAIQPNSSRAFLARAMTLAAMGQPAKAVADADEAILRNPKDPDGFLLRGRIHLQQNRMDDAMSDYTAAITVAPMSDKAFLERAALLRTQDQVAKSLADCDAAVRINPNSVGPYMCRAAAYLKMNATGPAVEQINLAMVTAQTLNQPSPLLQDLGKMMGSQTAAAPPVPAPTPVAVMVPPPVAVTPAPVPVVVTPVPAVPAPVVAAVPASMPNPAPAAPAHAPPAPTPLVAAILAANTNKAPKTTAPLAPGISGLPMPHGMPVTTVPPMRPVQNPAVASAAPLAQAPKPVVTPVTAQASVPAGVQDDADFYDKMGRVRSDEENFEEAVKLLSHAIQVDPKRPTAFNARGFAYLRLKQFDRAIADFTEAIRLNPGYGNAYHNRAVAKYFQGDRAASAADERKSNELGGVDKRPPARLAAQR
jgi:tetratricopeptide (TPR) repeat protein